MKSRLHGATCDLLLSRFFSEAVVVAVLLLWCFFFGGGGVYLYTLLSQWEFFTWEIRVAFPKKSQLQQSRAIQPLINYKVHAGSFRVSITHRTLTWTTGYLTCAPAHSYACVYTRGLGTSTAIQHNIMAMLHSTRLEGRKGDLKALSEGYAACRME